MISFLQLAPEKETLFLWASQIDFGPSYSNRALENAVYKVIFLLLNITGGPPLTRDTAVSSYAVFRKVLQNILLQEILR